MARASSKPCRTSSYAGSGAVCFEEGPAQSVEKPPGSIRVTWMPKLSTSAASAWEKPSSAHFEAW